MGLFDDLIKKPVQTDPLANTGGGGSSGGNPTGDGTNPGQPAFLIKKTEEQSIFSGSNISTPPTAFQPPVQPLSSGNSDDGNSLIIKNDSSIITPTSQPTPQATNLVQPIIQAQAPQPESIIINNETPSIAIIETPIDPINTVVNIPTSQNSLESLVTSVEDTHSMNSESDNSSTDSLFESLITNDSNSENDEGATLIVPKTEVEEEIFSPQEVAEEKTIEESPIIPTKQPQESYMSPKDFIEKSISNIDVMLGNIQNNHDTKIDEAKSYGLEKERFAELERKAYEEAAIMDGEKSHTLHMRALFTKELRKDEEIKNKIIHPEGSYVEATMTGIVQAKKVEDVMGHRPHRVKKTAANDDSVQKTA